MAVAPRFSRESIEDALRALGSNSPDEIEPAHQLILAWRDTNASIRAAIEIVCESDNETILFQAAIVALLDIETRWMSYVPYDRAYIRDRLCTRLIEFRGSELVQNKLIELVVAIALKDWPSPWDDCLASFIATIRVSVAFCVLDLKILAALVTAVHASSTVTNMRRRALIRLVQDATPQILDAVEWVLDTFPLDATGPPMCELLESLCLSAPPDMLLRPGFLGALVNCFVPNRETSESATRALVNLTIERPDAHSIVPSIIEELVSLLSGVVHEQVPDDFLLFMVRLLTEYGSIVDALCFPSEPDEPLVEWTTNVYRMLLSGVAVEKHCVEFWALWKSAVGRYSRAIRSRNPFDALQPCVRLFGGLIDEIRECLFMAFAMTAEGGGLRSKDCQTTWIFLTSVDKDSMVAFLGEQRPTPALCYAIGLVDCCLTGAEEATLMRRALPLLFEHNQTVRTIEFGASLLYAVSHSIRFLTRYPGFLTAFGTCLCAFLNADDGDVRSAAVNALLYVATRRPLLLVRDPEPICRRLSGGIRGWVVEWDNHKHVLKLAKAMAAVAAAVLNVDVRIALYEPVFAPIHELLLSSDPDRLELAYSLLQLLCAMKLPTAESAFMELLTRLSGILENAQIQRADGILTMAIDAITILLLTFDFESIATILEAFVTTLLGFAGFHELALVSVSKLRRKFVQMEVFYEALYATHVDPVLPTLPETHVEAFGVIRFLRRFRKRPELIGVTCQIGLHFLTDGVVEVAHESAKLLTRLVVEMGEAGDFWAVVDGRVPLMTAMFTVMTDGFHLTMFRSIAKLICAFFRVVSTSPQTIAVLDQEIVKILLPVTSDTQMIVNFARFLRTSYADLTQVIIAMNDFLVAVKCASASDKQLFTRGFEMDQMLAELVNLIDESEKDAVKAEPEIDLVELIRTL
jgi:hypothetical protein